MARFNIKHRALEGKRGQRSAAAQAGYWEQRSGAGAPVVQNYFQSLRDAGAGQKKGMTAQHFMLTRATAEDIWKRKQADRDFGFRQQEADRRYGLAQEGMGLRRKGMEDVMTRFDKEMAQRKRQHYLDYKMRKARHDFAMKRAPVEAQQRDRLHAWDIYGRRQAGQMKEEQIGRFKEDRARATEWDKLKRGAYGRREQWAQEDRDYQMREREAKQPIIDRMRKGVLEGRAGQPTGYDVDERGNVKVQRRPMKPGTPAKPYEPRAEEVSNIAGIAGRGGYEMEGLTTDQQDAFAGAVTDFYRRYPQGTPQQAAAYAAQQSGVVNKNDPQSIEGEIERIVGKHSEEASGWSKAQAAAGLPGAAIAGLLFKGAREDRARYWDRLTGSGQVIKDKAVRNRLKDLRKMQEKAIKHQQTQRIAQIRSPKIKGQYKQLLKAQEKWKGDDPLTMEIMAELEKDLAAGRDDAWTRNTMRSLMEEFTGKGGEEKKAPGDRPEFEVLGK